MLQKKLYINLFFSSVIAIFLVQCASQNKAVVSEKKETERKEIDTKDTLAVFRLKIDSIEKDSTKLRWISLSEAQVYNHIKPKKMIVDFYTHWCGPCKMYDRTTFANADVVRYVNKNYYAIKFNAEGKDSITFKGQTYSNPNFNPNATGRNYPHEWTLASGISGYPTIVFMDEKYEYLHKQTGIMPVNMLEMYVKFFANNTHLQTKTKEDWEAFQKSFTSEFKK